MATCRYNPIDKVDQTSMAISLTLTTSHTLPIEVPGVLPEHLAPLTLTEIERLPILCGSSTVPLAELFAVAHEPGDEERIVFRGSLEHVKRVAAGMTRGEISVDGSVGPHAASGMTGGKLHVHGDCGDWAAAHLAGGQVLIDGSVGRYLAGAYVGATKGMTGGQVIVRGSAGDDAACFVRRGLIAIAGDVGRSAAHGMHAGTLVVGGTISRWPGAGLKRGSLFALKPQPLELLPTFRAGAVIETTTYCRLVARHLEASGFPIRADEWPVRWSKSHGDALAANRGEVCVGCEAAAGGHSNE